jgi:hypothetical protein
VSFDYNPFKHVEIVDDPPTADYSTTQNPDTFAIYCHGCGSAKNRVPKTAPIEVAFKIIANHLRHSHAMQEDEVADWSVF